jgi:hypothetical protein
MEIRESKGIFEALTKWQMSRDKEDREFACLQAS